MPITTMSTNKKNKFNTSPNTKEWFPFAKHLFITEKHPVRQSEEKCSSSIESLFSQQEIEQIKGITNSLQCERRDAIRIALFEVAKELQEAKAKTYEKAKAGSTVKGHEGRKTTTRFNLPKSEKNQAEQAAEELGITIKEFLRLVVIWLADGIKEESITRLTKSKRLGKDEVAKQWSRANKGKPASTSVARLKEARDQAYKDAYIKGLENNERLYRDRGRMMKTLNDQGVGRVMNQFSTSGRTVNGHDDVDIDLNIVDAHLTIEHEEWVEAALEAEFQRREMNELEREIFRLLVCLPEGTPDEIIESMAKETIREGIEDQAFDKFLEESSDEQLLDADYTLFWQLRTPFSWSEMEEFKWVNEDDASRRNEESALDYVRRSLPEHLLSRWDAWQSE